MRQLDESELVAKRAAQECADQILPACDPEKSFEETVGEMEVFSLHVGVATNAHEQDRLERRRCYRQAGRFGVPTATDVQRGRPLPA